MKTQQTEFKNSIKKGKLDNYLKARGKRHTRYCVYTTISRAVGNYVVNNRMYLTDGSKWNDKIDAEQFTKTDNNIKRYGTCFSFSKDENVAMWMLYGGLYDEGVMCSFSKTYINGIIDCCKEVEFGCLDDKGFKSIKTISTKEIQLYLKDVLYYKENATSCYAYHNNSIKNGVSRKIIEQVGPTLKAIPWKYEDEVRLIIEVDKYKINSHCNCAMIDLASAENEYKNKYKKKLSREYNHIYCSPKLTDGECKTISIQKDGKEIAKAEPSKLANTIDWDLTKPQYKSIKKVSKNKEKVTINLI